MQEVFHPVAQSKVNMLVPSRVLAKEHKDIERLQLTIWGCFKKQTKAF